MFLPPWADNHSYTTASARQCKYGRFSLTLYRKQERSLFRAHTHRPQNTSSSKPPYPMLVMWPNCNNITIINNKSWWWVTDAFAQAEVVISLDFLVELSDARWKLCVGHQVAWHQLAYMLHLVWRHWRQHAEVNATVDVVVILLTTTSKKQFQCVNRNLTLPATLQNRRPKQMPMIYESHKTQNKQAVKKNVEKNKEQFITRQYILHLIT